MYDHELFDAKNGSLGLLEPFFELLTNLIEAFIHFMLKLLDSALYYCVISLRDLRIKCCRHIDDRLFHLGLDLTLILFDDWGWYFNFFRVYPRELIIFTDLVDLTS